MRKFLISVALISAVAVTAPASAQRGFERRFDQITYQIDRAAESGQITRYHARALNQRARNLDRLERSYSRDGFTRHERRQINDGFQSLREQLRSAMRYADNRSWNDDRRYRDRW